MSKFPLIVLSGLLAACAAQQHVADSHAAPAPAAPTPAAAKARDPFASTYQPAASGTTLIRGATVLTGTGTRLDNADVLIANGRIDAVGANLKAPDGAQVIDAKGRWVTPGIIDIHSH